MGLVLKDHTGSFAGSILSVANYCILNNPIHFVWYENQLEDAHSMVVQLKCQLFVESSCHNTVIHGRSRKTEKLVVYQNTDIYCLLQLHVI